MVLLLHLKLIFQGSKNIFFLLFPVLPVAYFVLCPPRSSEIVTQLQLVPTIYSSLIEPRHEKTCFCCICGNKGADQLGCNHAAINQHLFLAR